MLFQTQKCPEILILTANCMSHKCLLPFHVAPRTLNGSQTAKISNLALKNGGKSKTSKSNTFGVICTVLEGVLGGDLFFGFF